MNLITNSMFPFVANHIITSFRETPLKTLSQPFLALKKAPVSLFHLCCV